jgi:hypothetical protein
MCIFYTLANFGAVTCSIITTLRKVLQIALSVMAFGHRFTPLQIFGLVISFAGVGMNMCVPPSPPPPPTLCAAAARRALSGRLGRQVRQEPEEDCQPTAAAPEGRRSSASELR